MFLTAALGCLLIPLSWILYTLFIQPLFSPLRSLPGPDIPKGFGFGGHLNLVLNSKLSRSTHSDFLAKYGRTVRIKGLANFEDRLLSTDPAVLSHILNHPNKYQKPWQSRRVISRLIGEGLLSSEGEVHKRMRRVSTPAFSVHNLRALVPIAFKKASELREKWTSIIEESKLEKTSEGGSDGNGKDCARLDVCHWIGRAAFDVIGLAGFSYNFSAIQNEENELFLAYRDMFEIAVSQGGVIWDIIAIYFPWFERLFPNEKTRAVQKSQEVINRIGGQLVGQRKRQFYGGDKNDLGHEGTDILSLLIKSNFSLEIPPSHRLSDEEVLSNVNTYLFAGSDTTSLTLTWTLYLLATHPELQDRLRAELHGFAQRGCSTPTSDEKEDWQGYWSSLDELPYLNNVVRETLRLISPLHSSIRVATQDDEIPTSEPIRMRNGSVQYGVRIKKGQFVHIPVEAVNVDKSVWGDDAWLFNPDRWDNLPSDVLERPGLYNHILSFSGGPRSCIGMRFSLIVIKTFLYVLCKSFSFAPVENERVYAANVVLMRPYVTGKFKEGSQCPLVVCRV